MQDVYRATSALDKLAAMSKSGQESLADLARRLAVLGPNKTMITPRRVRILFNGAMVADTAGTSGAVYVWEHERYPQFYLPMEAFIQPAGFDVNLTPGESIVADDNSNTSRVVIAGYLKLSVKRTVAPDTDFKSLTEMVLFAADLQGPGKQLRNMVKVRFDAVGQWFEEDTPIYIHPKDPFKRVDILSSSRPIRVFVAGVQVAESPVSNHLYETTLPCRYYLPFTSLDTSSLRPSPTKSQCPYKGEAQYHSVNVAGVDYKDICWYYTRPTLECTPIASQVCFYNEHPKVEIHIMVKGKWDVLDRPTTHFL